ncbi:XRE family transcriptional regulator [Nocardia neocaledoniensis NBRC 108232]|uniref:XRE family transcriptional regulator n=1 Tax=Nocardia neocaledoniensis TaxID=236511 RepID=A0A317NI01_9NOCA|nr:XRE family transcriptional regulator [Nocardia neocaledoniensis]PWV74274.1 XRE family transcriptional regulator [Nocardia neocaledoniensis]GEM35136.1 XRE family transcriptional regulator [Nocardia neocaledoniensis NBRC 108232]
MEDQPGVGAVIDQIAPRLRRARARRGRSLAELARLTGLSTSTLSRLESGQRKPSLELLLPITVALGVPLDEIVAAPRVLVAREPPRRAGRTLIPLSRRRSGPRADKVIVPAHDDEPYPRVHDGYEWLFVLRGHLRVRLGEHEVVLGPGEVAEFDCRIPHWFGAAHGREVEILSLFGRHGERPRVRARGARPG